MASYYMAGGKHHEALHAISMLLEKSPGDINALGARADVMYSLGNYEKCIEDWNTVLAKQKGFLAYYNRGQCFFSLGLYLQAYGDFKNANALGADAKVYYAMGKCLKEFGEHTNAISSYKKALTMEPTLKEVAIDIAVAYMSLGKAGEATAYLNKALIIEPGYLVAYGFRATLYSAMGEAKLALKDSKYLVSTGQLDNDKLVPMYDLLYCVVHLNIVILGCCYVPQNLWRSVISRTR